MDAEKRTAVAKRNVRINTNMQAHTSYAKEMKDSLAEGMPPIIHISGNELT